MHISLQIVPITLAYNAAMAGIIRQVMTKYAAVGEGFSIMDPEVDTLFESYNHDNSAYFVLVDQHDVVWGGAGFGPLSGATEDICELRKMYFLEEIRGKGCGRMMLDLCMRAAARRGFRHMYLESLATMREAERLYTAAGFKPIIHAIGNTGHSSCNTFYIIDL